MSTTTPNDGILANLASNMISHYTIKVRYDNLGADKKVSATRIQTRELAYGCQVEARQIDTDVYETACFCEMIVGDTDGCELYDVNVLYGGMFQLPNASPEGLERALHIDGPMILFPHLQRVINDVTAAGGFEPMAINVREFENDLRWMVEVKRRNTIDDATDRELFGIIKAGPDPDSRDA